MLRVLIRLVTRPPPLPARVGPFGQGAAYVGHMTLYVLPFVAIILGWSEVVFGGHGVE